MTEVNDGCVLLPEITENTPIIEYYVPPQSSSYHCLIMVNPDPPSFVDRDDRRKSVFGMTNLRNYAHWVVCNPPANAPTATNGASWLEKYLHGILPIGGPFLGAPKSLRAVLSGDTMGLDMFLNDEEMLTLNRGLAGSCFLLPPTPL